MKATLISLLLASMTLAGQANPLQSETGEQIDKGTQHTGPSARQDSLAWQTVSLDGKGIKFKLPPDWRHDGMDMEAKHETYTIQEIDWNTEQDSLTNREDPNFHDRVSQWVSLVRTPYDQGGDARARTRSRDKCGPIRCARRIIQRRQDRQG